MSTRKSELASVSNAPLLPKRRHRKRERPSIDLARPSERWKFRTLSVTFVPHLSDTFPTQFHGGRQERDKAASAEVQKFQND